MRKAVNDVAIDELDSLGPALAEIGEAAALIVGPDPDGLYLYVEFGEGWYSVNLYLDEGNLVRNFEESQELSDKIYDTWLAQEPNKRWAVMEYEIRGSKFDAQFQFPDQVDVESFEVDRREEALKRRFGDKPIIYPPLPGTD